MTIAIRDLTDLDQALVDQNLTETTQRIQEDNPRLELRRGVFHDHLLYYHALLAAGLQTNIQDYLHARSLLDIQNDPALASPDLVDSVLSNFRVTRQAGTKATGEVTIVVAKNVTVIVAAGAVFTANGKEYITESVFTAKAEAAQINNANDRLLVARTDGNFAFNVTVLASEEGSDFRVRKDTLVIPQVLPASYVTSYAAADFTDGTNQETNEELLIELQNGISARTVSNRNTMRAMLRNDPVFKTILRSSIIGLGDTEMLRDQHTIFPMSLGGRMDWYIRSTEQVIRTRLVKEATLIEKTEDQRGIWRFTLARDEAPGFYELQNIKLQDATETAGGFGIVVDTRGLDLTGDGFRPDVVSAVEGVYSRFQTADISFSDSVTSTTDLAIGAKQSYEMDALLMIQVAELQDAISGRDHRSYGADALIKAAVPCFVQLSCTVFRRSGTASPDLAAIKQALAETVNAIDFVGRLYASRLQDVIQGFLSASSYTSAIDMLGRIRRPDGSSKYLRSTEVLTVPEEGEKMVSARTVQFFIDPEDISISLQTLLPEAV